MDKTSVSIAADCGFDFESGQTNDLNIDIHSLYLLDFQHSEGQCRDSTTTIVIFFMLLFFYDSTLKW